MAGERKPGMLLGQDTPLVQCYAPELLYPIARSEGRERLGLPPKLPFFGADLWHAYEMSWLDGNRRPVSGVGRFTVPATSPSMVESKSFKLYLNSLNNHVFASTAELVRTVSADLAAVVGAPIEVELLVPDDSALAGARLSGQCLDGLAVDIPAAEPHSSLLHTQSTAVVEEQLHTHLLRSLCPVTAQPDWATLWVHYRGTALNHESLLAYILAFRQHQEFHEQCVERVFRDLSERCQPQMLHVQAFYTRRGGLDINPFRSTDAAARPLPRLNRQ